MRFYRRYFFIAIILLLTEVCIALFIRDKLVRPYIGDILVVILIYSVIQTMYKLPVLPSAWAVFAFACFIEMLQYFKFVEVVGLSHSGLARTIIGTSFSWTDILMYFVGTLIIIVAERILKHRLSWRNSLFKN